MPHTTKAQMKGGARAGGRREGAMWGWRGYSRDLLWKLQRSIILSASASHDQSPNEGGKERGVWGVSRRGAMWEGGK